VEGPRADAQQRQFSQLRQVGPALGFRQHRAGVARGHAAQAEHLLEHVHPLGFDAHSVHKISPSMR
jgi:hypothetical protein